MSSDDSLFSCDRVYSSHFASHSSLCSSQFVSHHDEAIRRFSSYIMLSGKDRARFQQVDCTYYAYMLFSTLVLADVVTPSCGVCSPVVCPSRVCLCLSLSWSVCGPVLAVGGSYSCVYGIHMVAVGEDRAQRLQVVVYRLASAE